MYLLDEIAQAIKSLTGDELSDEFTNDRTERAQSSERRPHADREHVFLREPS